MEINDEVYVGYSIMTNVCYPVYSVMYTVGSNLRLTLYDVNVLCLLVHRRSWLSAKTRRYFGLAQRTRYSFSVRLIPSVE